MAVWVSQDGREGRLLADDEAVVSAYDHGVTVGDGVFETMKVVDGAPFALTRHLRRLGTSAEGLGLPVPADGQLRAAVAAVLTASPPAVRASGRLRVTVTGGRAPLGSDRGTTPPTLIVAAAPLAPWPATTAVATVPWTRNEHSAVAGLKTTSYAENVVALAYARARGASEALLANTAGMLCEGTGSNVVVVLDGQAVTPTLSSGCLAGITRELLLEWGGSGVVEADVAMEDLASAQELVLTSSTRDLQPVTVLDGRPVGDGEVGRVTRELVELFGSRAAVTSDP